MSCGRTPEEYRSFFAGIFRDLDERPRIIGMKIHAEGLTVDLAEGKVVFSVEGAGKVTADFSRRWLAEHPVPLRFRKGVEYLVFEPAGGNRVRVKKANFWERMRA